MSRVERGPAALVVGFVSLVTACAGQAIPPTMSGSEPLARASSTPPMTARSWQREAEPGWRWAPSPVRFWYGPGGEGAIADELLGGVDPARVRAVMLRLDVTETERCANGGGLAFAATDEHREIIARTGRIPIRAEHRYRLDTLVAWLTERLIAVGLARDRIRTELNPLIDVGDAPAETLLRPNVELVFLVRVGGR